MRRGHVSDHVSAGVLQGGQLADSLMKVRGPKQKGPKENDGTTH